MTTIIQKADKQLKQKSWSSKSEDSSVHDNPFGKLNNKWKARGKGQVKTKRRKKWSTKGYFKSLEVYSFSLREERKGYSFSSEERVDKSLLWFISHLQLLPICISLSPSIVNSSCKSSRSLQVSWRIYSIVIFK